MLTAVFPLLRDVPDERAESASRQSEDHEPHGMEARHEHALFIIEELSVQEEEEQGREHKKRGRSFPVALVQKERTSEECRSEDGNAEAVIDQRNIRHGFPH